MSTLIANPIAETPATLAREPGVAPPGEKRSRRWWMAAVAVAVIGGGGFAGWKYYSQPAAVATPTAEVRRGNVRQTISATGKVQALVTVQVGTQVSGTVSALYADFNSRVKAGQVIARLEPSQIEAQVKQSQASLAGAEANAVSAANAIESAAASVEAARANVGRTDAVLLEANRAYENTQRLAKEGVTPARQIQTDEATRLQAMAQKAQAEAQLLQALSQLESVKAQLVQAKAQVTQARAAVDVAKVNLDRTIIRAPIDGVVISRNVDVGQTVAASLQAPTLFLIANDLTKMQVLADVDEADVGMLSGESAVSFTVDAYPKETFSGRIAQIRLAPAVVQNVVTYTAVIEVGNPKLQLKPGMTATVTVVVAEKKGVLVVPSAAFRANAQAGTRPSTRGGGMAVLWRVLPNGEMEAVRARAGMSDGAMTELTETTLAEGDRVATVAVAAATAKKATGTTSAFPGAAQPPRGRRY